MRDWRGVHADEKPSRERDIADLRRLVNITDDGFLSDSRAARGSLSDNEIEAFAGMLYDLRRHEMQPEHFPAMLTERQRAWVKSVLDRVEGGVYENLVSRGLVSSATKVETIPALRRENLPMKPPPKRKRDD